MQFIPLFLKFYSKQILGLNPHFCINESLDKLIKMLTDNNSGSHAKIESIKIDSKYLTLTKFSLFIKPDKDKRNGS